MTAMKKNGRSPGRNALILSQDTYLALAQKIYQIAGIHLPYSEKNVALMINRLSRVVGERRFSGFEELNERLKLPDDKLKSDFISSMTTNKTEFFREEAHFDFLKKHLPEIVKSKPNVRVWSAACSYGAEPYTISIVVQELLGLVGRNRVKILATDIDREVLEKAIAAQYSVSEMEGLSAMLRQKYFQAATDRQFILKSDLTKNVHFSEFNLMNFSYRSKEKFDFIFCRNVLIYFDKATTDKVVDMLVANLELNGYLIIGHSESGVIQHPCLKSLGHSIFQKVRM